MYKIIDEKGRVTIPLSLREKLKLQPNTIVSLKECGGCLAIHPEKICDNCSDKKAKSKAVEAFDRLSPEEKEAVICHIGNESKGCGNV